MVAASSAPLASTLMDHMYHQCQLGTDHLLEKIRKALEKDPESSRLGVLPSPPIPWRLLSPEQVGLIGATFLASLVVSWHTFELVAAGHQSSSLSKVVSFLLELRFGLGKSSDRPLMRIHPLTMLDTVCPQWVRGLMYVWCIPPLI